MFFFFFEKHQPIDNYKLCNVYTVILVLTQNIKINYLNLTWDRSKYTRTIDYLNLIIEKEI